MLEVVSFPVFVPLRLVAVIFPLSSIVAPLFCAIFPVVQSNRIIALSADDAGHEKLHGIELAGVFFVVLSELSTNTK